MKKSTTKILLAALSLVMALGIATGSTFAWFTSNRTVSIGAIDAEVVSGSQGLYVALYDYDAGTYGAFKTSVTAADIAAATLTTGSVLLDALTTNNNGVTLTRRDGTAEPAYAEDADNSYLEFKLKFRTTTAQDIYLGWADDSNPATNSTITPGTATLTPVLAWRAISDGEYGQSGAITIGGALNARAAHAARVAFITGTTPSGVIWAPYDYTSGNDDGCNTQAGFYLGNLASDYEANLLGTSANAYTTQNKNAVVLLENDDAISGTTTGCTKIVTTVDNGAGAYDAEVTVRIWVEGTDGDCLNSIFSDVLSVMLVFNSTEAATVSP